MAVSVFFYAWGSPVYAAMLVASVAINFGMAVAIDANGSSARIKRLILIASLVLNIGMLCVMKCADFFIANINRLFGADLPLPHIPLPVGISFFTFQALSYVIDVYRGGVPVQRNYIRLLLYISLFPQLIAGPIVRYGDIEPMLEKREIRLEDTAYGLRRFIAGLAKKLLLADTLGVIADKIFNAGAGVPLPLPAWIGAIAYTMQIYFDFSGYSDMAIGMGRMMGFRFKENFIYPYAALGVRDFWRRWHISLSTWFKEYVYIPLGGNRRGKARECANKLTVFLLTGFWHGANWTFVVWGLYHGFFIMLESFGAIKTRRIPSALVRIYTLLTVTVGFVLFRAETLAFGFAMIASMFNVSAIGSLSGQIAQSLALLPPSTLILFAVAPFAAAPLSGVIIKRIPKTQAAFFVLSFIALALCVFKLAADGYNPFIYYRF
jgi:alginate O-acetyltransferase complex protein AlgI